MTVENQRSMPSRTAHAQASVVVIDALQEYDGIDIDAGEFQLYDFIEPDALDAIFSHRPTGSVSIQFDIREVTVTVWRAADDIRARVRHRPE
ncbi:HalOD1 output domain-containing protein [Haladaptatus sp. NG-SE-30]